MVTPFPDLQSRAQRGTAAFTLSKWYLDCVAPDGRVVIAYWASLGWRDLSITWQQVTLHDPGQPARRQSSLSSSPPPAIGPDAITWLAPALDCRIDVRPRQGPIRHRLLDDSTGIVEWRADAPAADVSVALGGRAPMQGTGYAERLLVTVLQWHLPIRELRWGRWIDAAANLLATRDEPTLRALAQHAARRIHAAFRLGTRERHRLVRMLLRRLWPLG
mgnify:CR=1 FL=1